MLVDKRSFRELTISIFRFIHEKLSRQVNIPCHPNSTYARAKKLSNLLSAENPKLRKQLNIDRKNMAEKGMYNLKMVEKPVKI